MASQNILKSCVMACVLVLAFFVAFELHWRRQGFVPTFNDDKVLWATKRKEIYLPLNEATVFVGGSRIKFDLDMPTWEKLTGEKAIQLAIVGTPGRVVLLHLANDTNFKGKLILDVADGQFFSFVDSARRDKSAREAIEYYKEETPAQETSAKINYFLESVFVGLEEGKFSTTALLHDFNLKNRPGINVRPPFPKGFNVTNFDRQSLMTPMFFGDTSQLNYQKRFWRTAMRTLPVIKGDTLLAFLKQTKKAIDKIRSRGGSVVFVRPPSSGEYIKHETLHYPREKYWDRLLEFTGCEGIHFADYPSTSKLTCPEWSHLKQEDAARYTAELVKILEQDVGWTFSNKINRITQITHLKN
jgi:hypothetical protein